MSKVKLLFAWYDLWIGAYWDKKSNRLYLLPLPMFGIVISFTKFVEGETVGINAYKNRSAEYRISYEQKITKVWKGRDGQIFYNTEHCNSLRKTQITKIKRSVKTEK